MEPNLTYKQIAELERRIVTLGSEPLPQGTDQFLRDASTWYAALSDQLRARLGSAVVSLLHDFAEVSRDDASVGLLVGALRVIRTEAEQRPLVAAYCARFVIHKLNETERVAPRSSRATIPAGDLEAALTLYEAAKGDRSFSNDELRNAATDFIGRNRSQTGLLGQLVGNLRFLLDVLDERDAAGARNEAARAALTYFALVEDAIHDGLGLVGILDDALVVEEAVNEIDPRRGRLVEVLGRVISEWPFLLDIELGAGAARQPPSEFTIANCAPLADPKHMAAVVITTLAGPLPIVVGTLAAMAELRRFAQRKGPPAFERGERLQLRGGGPEVVFKDYVFFRGTVRVSCDPAAATHFVFEQTRCEHTRRIQDLSCFRRSSRPSAAPLRSGRVKFDLAAQTVGPLETLFGLHEPLRLPSKRRRVVVVSAFGDARALLEALTLYGTPLVDLLPATQARALPDGMDERPLSTKAPGGQPILTIVRTLSEALELIEEEHESFNSVVAPVHDATDAVALTKIVARGVHCLAFVAERVGEAHEYLATQNFGFWVWDEAWLSTARPPNGASRESHPINDYELRLRDSIERRVTWIPLKSPEQTAAYMDLRALTRLATVERSTEDVNLAIFVETSLRLHSWLRTKLTPASEDDENYARSQLTHLKALADSGGKFWPDEVLQPVRHLIAALTEAWAALCTDNPKWARVRQWVSENPDGVVLCRPSVGHSLERSLSPTPIRWTTRVEDIHHAVLIPAWLNAQRMEPLLYPPVARRTELLLYEIEQDWMRNVEQRHRDTATKIRTLSDERSAFGMAAASTTSGVAMRPERAEEILPDAAIVQARRARILSDVSDASLETVSAKLVHFAGNHWAAFALGSRVHTITHMLGPEASKGVDERDQLRERVASDLQPDDLVVMLRGSDRDAIRHAVDEVAPSHLRERAAEWQRALQRFGETRSIKAVTAALSAAGCTRHAATIRYWLTDPNSIRPRGGRDDIVAIATVTRDPFLNARLEECIAATEELFRLHVRAGQMLASQIRSKASAWLRDGVAPDELVEVDDRLVVVTVELVDPHSIQVPRASCNQLMIADAVSLQEYSR